MKTTQIFLFALMGCTITLAQTNTFPDSGSVGIGTITPSIWFNNNVVEIKDQRPVLSFNSTGTLGTLVFTNTQKGSNNYGEFHFNHEFSTLIPDESTFRFFAYPGGDILVLKAHGNVGIGTLTPDEKLTVKGKIHAEEVKVDLSVPGPDYVFKEDYDLRSLKEVQEHIRENGHLPNIPSAREMEENGVELGTMNMKLLEKIEELTLYTITQEKRIKHLEKENKTLRSITERMEKIEALLKAE
ncbi:tail fiber protein [Ulvibacterium marinum]|uniref:BZIP transcription factor n=1 Tax=Ulvibacterium marinum TaxID=2419782 RepID=A0A3B0C9H8_9FLAO|nr:tail fiber protein [Ulvibacterium marinum]RKN82422.1 hypothetical protein D7Z94_00785 [Ulvibacterium marinum]